MRDYLTRQSEKILRLRSRDSNTKMDLMKIYGIFCVVHAHATYYGFSLSSHLNISSIYVIQLFMFCSGYFYRTATDDIRLLPYLKKCAKAYLVPYFTWNLIYGILCQLLRQIGLISFGDNLSLYSFFVRPWLDAEQYLLNLPSWFLLSLFLVAMITWGVRHLLSRRGPIQKRTDYLLLLGFFLVGLLSVVLLGQGEYHLGFKAALFRPLVLLPYYQLGLVYRTYWEGGSTLKKCAAAVILLLIQILLPIVNGSSFVTHMVYGYFEGNPLLLVLGAITAILLIAVLCDFLAPVFRRFRPVRYISRCTMYIMLHHMFLLFLIQLGIRILNHFIPLPDYSAAAFSASIWYSYHFGHNWVRCIYLFIALLTPVLLHRLYEAVILRLGTKLSKRSTV